jgi:competence protein ComEC
MTFVMFIAFRAELGAPFAAAAFAALASSSGWFLLGTVRPAKSSLPVICSLIILSLVGVASIDSRISRSEHFPETIEADGVVLQERRMGFSNTAVVKTLRRGMFGRREKYALRHDGELVPGDIVRFSGDVNRFKRPDGRGKFDEFLYWKSRGVSVAVKARSVKITGREFGLPYLRHVISDRIGKILPRRTAGYIAAAWLGERDRDLQDFHSNAGTSHILAVSGLHIGMAAALCWMLVRRLRGRLYIMSAVIWSYALLSGASPSSVRAALMLQVIFAGRLLGQSGGAFNGACFAASAMLLWNPWLFWDVGWRMSVLSVMSLASLHSLEIGRAAKFALSSPVMWLATSVQSAWTFGAVPLAGVLINFFAVPFFGVVLPAASLMSFPAALGFRIGKIFALPAELCFALWERFSNNITYLIPWKLDFSYPLYAAGVLTMTYLFAGACGFPRSRAYFALAAAVPLISYIILFQA